MTPARSSAPRPASMPPIRTPGGSPSARSAPRRRTRRSAFPSRDVAAVLRRRGAGARFRRDLRAPGGAGGARWSRSTSRRSTRWPSCSTPGAWVAERHTVLAAAARQRPRGGRSGGPRDRQRAPRGSRRPTHSADSTGWRRCGCEIEPMLDAVDLLCVPSIPTFYSLADLARGSDRVRTPGSGPIPTSSICSDSAASRCRLRRGRDGRPGSVTLLARAGRDGLLASLGAWIERQGDRTLGATGWVVPPLADILPAAERRRDRDRGLRRAHVWPAAQPRAGAARRTLPARGADHADYRLYSLPAGRRAARGCCAPRRQRGRDPGRGLGAAPPRPSATSSPGFPRRSRSVRSPSPTAPRRRAFSASRRRRSAPTDVTALGDWRRVIAERCGVTARLGPEAHMCRDDAPALGAAHPDLGLGPALARAEAAILGGGHPDVRRPKARMSTRDSSRARSAGVAATAKGGDRRRSRRARPRSSSAPPADPPRKTRSEPPRRSRAVPPRRHRTPAGSPPRTASPSKSCIVPLLPPHP